MPRAVSLAVVRMVGSRVLSFGVDIWSMCLLGYEDVAFQPGERVAVIGAYDSMVEVFADGLGQVTVPFFPELHFGACEQGEPADEMHAVLDAIVAGSGAVKGIAFRRCF